MANITQPKRSRRTPGEARRERERLEAQKRSRAREIEESKKGIFDPSDPLNPTPDELDYHERVSQRQRVSRNLLIADISLRSHPRQELVDFDADDEEGAEEAAIWSEKARRALDIPQDWIEDVKVYPDAVVFVIEPQFDPVKWPKWAEDTTMMPGFAPGDPNNKRAITVKGRILKKIFFRLPPYDWQPSHPRDYSD